MVDVSELDRDLSTAEIVWARPENFRPAQMADYVTKLAAANMPLPMVAEEIGWTPQRVEQLRAELAEAAFRAASRRTHPGPGRSPAGRHRHPSAQARTQT